MHLFLCDIKILCMFICKCCLNIFQTLLSYQFWPMITYKVFILDLTPAQRCVLITKREYILQCQNVDELIENLIQKGFFSTHQIRELRGEIQTEMKMDFVITDVMLKTGKPDDFQMFVEALGLNNSKIAKELIDFWKSLKEGLLFRLVKSLHIMYIVIKNIANYINSTQVLVLNMYV